jgi:hypothetical protein
VGGVVVRSDSTADTATYICPHMSTVKEGTKFIQIHVSVCAHERRGAMLLLDRDLGELRVRV